VVTYDQFDEDGDDVNSGVYEEFWAGPKKYRRSYKSDSFSNKRNMLPTKACSAAETNGGPTELNHRFGQR